MRGFARGFGGTKQSVLTCEGVEAQRHARPQSEMRAALPAVEVCPSQVRAARPQRQHSKQAASHRPSYRHRKWPTYAAPQGEGEVFACALPDYSDSQTSSSGAVYACALPEPTVAKASKGEMAFRWCRAGPTVTAQGAITAATGQRCCWQRSACLP